MLIFAAALALACSGGQETPTVDSLLQLLPQNADSFTSADLERLRDERLDDLERQLAILVDAERLDEWQIDLDDVDSLIISDPYGGDALTLLRGAFWMEDIEDALDDEGFRDSIYRDVTVWSERGGDVTLALVGDDVVVVGEEERVEEALDVFLDDERAMSHDDETTAIVDALEDALLYSVSEECGYRACRRSATGIRAEGRGLAAVVAYSFRDEDAAYDAERDIEDLMDIVGDDPDVSVDGPLVVAVSSVEEDQLHFPDNAVLMFSQKAEEPEQVARQAVVAPAATAPAETTVPIAVRPAPTAFRPATPQPTSPAIPVGSEWYGSIDDGDDVDFFSFRASGGREYVIETRLDSNLDMVLTLYNRAGDIIDQHDDSGSGGGERMVWVTPSTGTYYIEVKGYSGATGTYHLSLNEVATPRPTATPRPAAQPQATDEPATQLARIPAALAGGQSVLSNGEFSRGFTDWAEAGASTGCDLPIGVSILDYDQPNSNVLQIKTNRWVNCNMSGLKRSLNLRVPDDSEVVLAADVKSIYSDVRNACGDWGDEMPLLLELSYLTAGGDTRSISWKFTHKTGGTCERLTGWHDVGLRSRSAIISGDRDREFGETITVPMNTWFAFTSQDVKALDDSMATITQLSVFGAGWDYQSQVDNITLSVGSAATEAPTPAPTAAPAPTDTPRPTAAPARVVDDHGNTPSGSTRIGGEGEDGSIEDASDVDFFSFRASGGREYVIETHLGTNPDTVLTLYNRAGDIIDQHDDSGSGGGERMVWVAPSTGTYYIEVKGYSGATGTYRLSLNEAVIGSSRQGGELRLALDADPFPDSFTPLEDLSFGGAAQINSLIFSRLWRVGPSGVEFDLVEWWQISISRQEFTVGLRQDARFHDGRPVTAADVAYSIEAMQRYSPVHADLSAIDGYTLRILFEEPFTDFGELVDDFISRMARSNDAIVVPRGMLDLPINSFTDLVGSGPFVPAAYEKDDYLVLERNPAYYEEGLPYVDAVRVSVIPERATRFAAFFAGQIDFLGYPRVDTPFLTPFLTQQEHAQISRTYPDAAFGTYPYLSGLWFDTQNPPFDDRLVRMAVNRAIDMERLSGVMWAGELQGTVPDALFPALHTALDEPEALSEWHSYDPENARQLLADAGYADGLETVLQVPAHRGDYWLDTAEMVAEMLGQVGIYVVLEEIESYAEYRVAPADRGMKIAVARDYNRDVVGFFRYHFAEGGTFNHSRTNMPVSGIDPANPSSILQAQIVLNEMVYYIPLLSRSYARNERVHGPLAVEYENLGVTLRQLWLVK